jgi:hypothetical protein
MIITLTNFELMVHCFNNLHIENLNRQTLGHVRYGWDLFRGVMISTEGNLEWFGY